MVMVGYAMNLPKSNAAVDVLETQDAVLKFMFDLGRLMCAEKELVKKLVVLTSDAQSDKAALHGEFGVGVVANSTMEGFVGSLRVELGTTPILLLDMDWYLDDATLERVALEILRPGIFGTNQVRVNSKGRFCARIVEHAPYAFKPTGFSSDPVAKPAFKSFLSPESLKDGVLILTGGNGALAMVMAQYLLDKMSPALKKKSQLKIYFLSRSAKVPEANDAEWAKVLSRVKGTAIVCEQAKCDASSQRQVEAFIETHTPNVLVGTF